MSELAVKAVELDLTVYGRRQVAYQVDGQDELVDYTSVVDKLSMRQVVAFESEVAAYAAVVNKRKTKLEKLGQALAVLRRAVSKFEAKATSKDEVNDSELPTVSSVFGEYGLSVDGISHQKKKKDKEYKYYITKKGATMAAQVAESEIDIENAELDEVTTVMQGVITKRNNAYSTSTTLQRKTTNTANTLIKGMVI